MIAPAKLKPLSGDDSVQLRYTRRGPEQRLVLFCAFGGIETAWLRAEGEERSWICRGVSRPRSLEPSGWCLGVVELRSWRLGFQTSGLVLSAALSASALPFLPLPTASGISPAVILILRL